MNKTEKENNMQCIRSCN